MNYSQRIDKHFPKYFSYRTLRCVFDPKGSEWWHCDLEKKIEILKNVLTIKPLEYWIAEYAKYYKILKKEYVLVDIPQALFILYEYAMEWDEEDLAHTIKEFLQHTDMQIVSGFERVYREQQIVAVMGEAFQKHQDAYDELLARVEAYWLILEKEKAQE
jgi:hypothetical protein